MGVTPTYTRIAPFWRGETCVCIATGPSLTAEDVEQCRGRRVIAVNDAVRLAPWADVLYACDYQWWRRYDGVPSFHGVKYGLDPRSAKYGVHVLKNTGTEGLEADPSGIRTGHNSGYQAIHVAWHLGVTKIILLGYDMQRSEGKSHFFGEHPDGLRRPPLAIFIPQFVALSKQIRGLNVEIVNATRTTALTCFPRLALDQALATEVAA
jgi:hypothetical protein